VSLLLLWVPRSRKALRLLLAASVLRLAVHKRAVHKLAASVLRLAVHKRAVHKRAVHKLAASVLRLAVHKRALRKLAASVLLRQRPVTVRPRRRRSTTLTVPRPVHPRHRRPASSISP
jgi:hypothetical protein